MESLRGSGPVLTASQEHAQWREMSSEGDNFVSPPDSPLVSIFDSSQRPPEDSDLCSWTAIEAYCAHELREAWRHENGLFDDIGCPVATRVGEFCPSLDANFVSDPEAPASRLSPPVMMGSYPMSAPMLWGVLLGVCEGGQQAGIVCTLSDRKEVKSLHRLHPFWGVTADNEPNPVAGYDIKIGESGDIVCPDTKNVVGKMRLLDITPVASVSVVPRREVVHLEIVWKDFKAISAIDGVFLAETLLALQEEKKDEALAGVFLHCRGGIGRTGTVAALMLMVRMHRKRIRLTEVDVGRIIVQLRKDRSTKTVQTKEQYDMLIRSIDVLNARL